MNPLDEATLSDLIVGAAIRRALDEIAKREPDRGKWLLGLLQEKLPPADYRRVRREWHIPARWPLNPRPRR